MEYYDEQNFWNSYYSYFWYYQNFDENSLGQLKAVDVDDVAKWRQNLI